MRWKVRCFPTNGEQTEAMANTVDPLINQLIEAAIVETIGQAAPTPLEADNSPWWVDPQRGRRRGHRADARLVGSTLKTER